MIKKEGFFFVLEPKKNGNRKEAIVAETDASEQVLVQRADLKMMQKEPFVFKYHEGLFVLSVETMDSVLQVNYKGQTLDRCYVFESVFLLMRRAFWKGSYTPVLLTYGIYNATLRNECHKGCRKTPLCWLFRGSTESTLSYALEIK